MMTPNIYRICFTEILQSDFPGLTRAQINDCAVLAHRFGIQAAQCKAAKLQSRMVLRRVQMRLYWDKINFLRFDAGLSELCAKAWGDVQSIVYPQNISL